MSRSQTTMSSPQKPTWSQAPARSITFDAGSKTAIKSPTLRDVPGTAAATNAGRQAAVTLPATGAEPVTPFSDGITERRAERYGEENLPAQMALKLEWPLDEVGYNKLRKDGGKGASAGGPSLVYYRKYLEMDGSDDVVHTGIKLALKGHSEISVTPGKVLFRVICEKPCWSTESRRYESPIQVGIGRAGPIVYEVRPTAPKGGRSKRQSQWTLYQKRTSMQTRARTEDLEGTLISFLSPWGMPFQVYTSSETKIKLEFKDAEYEVAQFDPADGFGALHIDSRPYGTPFKSPRRSAIEVAYIIAVFEAAHAMRDELAGGGKNRRDEYGRLSLTTKNVIAKAFSRILRT